MVNESRSASFKESNLTIYTVDSFSKGVTFGQPSFTSRTDFRRELALQIPSEAQAMQVQSRYTLNKEDPVHQLERYLMKLSSAGTLRSSHIFFGTMTDPFHPFAGKFDQSIKLLDLFKRYTPGMLTVQTRSPLIVLALPVFAALGKHVSVTLAVETSDEQAIRRYTPAMPRIDERLKTAQALRRFGVEVTLQVGPLLPYGDWKDNAIDFAKLLCDNGDYIQVIPLSDGSDVSERKIRQCLVAKRLADDRKFHWLRTDATTPLVNSIRSICPGKLDSPDRSKLVSKQLSLFAA